MKSGNRQVHEKVGKEPSGHGFNKITLTRDNKAHNPLINTGSISLASLYLPEHPMAERFQSAMSRYQALVKGSGEMLHFNNTVYLSELDNGHRNYAIGYYLKSKGCLKDKVNLKETLELYFQMCSIETSIRNASVLAAALANGGRNVFTGEQIISERSVQNMLSIMFSCGMYDYSGEWAFEVGIPAKSGVSGLIIVVIPDVMGLALWSPRLDSYGNSVRGVKFAREMVKKYSHGRSQNVLHPFSNRSLTERVVIRTPKHSNPSPPDLMSWTSQYREAGGTTPVLHR
ncbi:putative glutaminase 3 [Bolinopsis microptera]|uniref:putative glutaminase 3 n=1 Tax=Bolinopsis microptera TaxID=2820187 RepID=UPI00307926F2